MDEHRCRAWWVAHKHYLRVGDAVKRNVAAQLKTVRQLKPRAIRLALCACAVYFARTAAFHAARRMQSR